MSSVSQLSAASPEELTDESLLYVSISSDDPAYVSRKLRYGDLRDALSAGLSVERMRLSVEMLENAVNQDGKWIDCNTHEPFVISSIYEDHGVILSVEGYPLSSSVGNTLSNNLWFKSSLPPDAESEAIGVILFGGKDELSNAIASCEISATALQPLVKLVVWPGANNV